MRASAWRRSPHPIREAALILSAGAPVGGLDQVQSPTGARGALVPVVIAPSAHERCIVVVIACGNDRRTLRHTVMIAIGDAVFLACNDEDAPLGAVSTGVCAD